MSAFAFGSGMSLPGPAPRGAIDHYEDPLDADDPRDVPVTTSRRGLMRLAVVAAEVGARFQREDVGHDAVAWLIAPRRLFNGSTALDACLGRDACTRAVLLHGLSLGLDAEPEQIDALLCDAPKGVGGDCRDGFGSVVVGAARPPVRPARLYSALMMVTRGGELMRLFHASVAPGTSEVRERIRARFGAGAASRADIRVGVDLDCPITVGMLPPAFRELVERSRRVRWSAMAGLDLTVEHRIPS